MFFSYSLAAGRSSQNFGRSVLLINGRLADLIYGRERLAAARLEHGHQHALRPRTHWCPVPAPHFAVHHRRADRLLGLSLAGAQSVVEPPGQLRDLGFELGDTREEIPTAGTRRLVHAAIVVTEASSRSDVGLIKYKWLDNKGRVWEVVRSLANGRYYLTTAGQKQTAERNAYEIRQMTQMEK